MPKRYSHPKQLAFPMATQRQAPALYYWNVPESQQHAHQLVGHALDNIAYFLESFDADLKLFDHCAKQIKTSKSMRVKHTFRGWQFVAARDGAISIHNFGRSLEALQESLSQCQYVSSRLGMKELSASRRQFNALFPNYVEVRNAVGHAAEKARNTSEHLRHGFTGNFSKKGFKLKKARSYVAIDVLHGRNFLNTWKGNMESYRIAPKTLKDLMSIRDRIFDAFDIMNDKYRGE